LLFFLLRQQHLGLQLLNLNQKLKLILGTDVDMGTEDIIGPDMVMQGPITTQFLTAR